MSTTYSFCITETFYPLNNNFPQPMATTILLLHIILFSPFNNLVKRDIHSRSAGGTRDIFKKKGKVGSGLLRMRSAEQGRTRRDNTFKGRTQGALEKGAHPQSSCWWNWCRKNTAGKEQKAEGLLHGHARAFGPCLWAEGALTCRPGANLGTMWAEAWIARMEGNPGSREQVGGY